MIQRPIIGITSHTLEGQCARSAVNQAYIDAVVAAGGVPLCIALKLDSQSLDQLYDLIEGLLLPGGDDVAPERYGNAPHPMLGAVDPFRDELEIYLAQRALADDLPLLGICRGIQVMAVAGGGTLYQDLPSQNPTDIRHEVREFGRAYLSHSVRLTPDSMVARALGQDNLAVNSFHHQAVRDLPAGFVATAISDDGLIEAMEAPARRFAVGVQCHPEELWSTTAPEFAGLFKAFVDTVKQLPSQVALAGQ